MSKGQKAGAVRRKQAKSNTGPKPSRAATFAPKRMKAAEGRFVARGCGAIMKNKAKQSMFT